MDIRLIAIPLVFLVMAGVLCWCLVVMRGEWRRRLALIVAMPLLSLLIWAVLPSYMGWPTEDAPPEKVMLLWADVREPDRQTGDPGAIYLWVVTVDEESAQELLAYPASRGEPRAYAFPYSRRGHEILAKAKQRIAGGQSVILEMLGGPDGSAGPEREGQPQGSSLHRSRERGPNIDGDDFRMYELPNASFPDKEE